MFRPFSTFVLLTIEASDADADAANENIWKASVFIVRLYDNISVAALLLLEVTFNILL